MEIAADFLTFFVIALVFLIGWLVAPKLKDKVGIVELVALIIIFMATAVVATTIVFRIVVGLVAFFFLGVVCAIYKNHLKG